VRYGGDETSTDGDATPDAVVQILDMHPPLPATEVLSAANIGAVLG
jgi:hypothetical protein